jgi:hypothetical protein
MELVREQLGPVLGIAPFRNSKRFPAFLPHAVEHAQSCVGLIERTIGHDVFGVIPVTTPRRIQLCE